ncbi:isochorismatase family cysteine hydrolase [Acidiplasma sp.]|uniref:cysteine hydrolase family protein n=1 Tax=Acidiplasma sp. TaxID=1872114 RepID=UPI002589A7A8|nr:isochorismatase family cysteine hydrolase [Acidiplasma sp.]
MEQNNVILIVDMINDFVTGKFGNKKALNAANRAADVLKYNKMPVVFARDFHIKNDPEFRVWGEHALMNTPASEIYEKLKKYPDFIVNKRHYDAFHDTDLDSLLRFLNAKKLYLFGISTDICVMHTASGAFYRNYDVTVVSDLCASIDENNHEDALKKIKINYGYNSIDSEEFKGVIKNE